MIPGTCHFVWLGKSFPWLNALAVASAACAGGFDRIVLHHDEDLEGSAHVAPLHQLGGFELRRVDLGALARGAGERPERVRDLYENMASAAARSDVLRALVLAGEGGVYLDMDTVTLAPFDALRARPAFVGQELICFPEWSTRLHSPGEVARAYGLAALRASLRVLPEGYRWFGRFAKHYALAVNNAVLGAEPTHAFVMAYLRGMLQMPPALARKRFAVGPDLLARICREEAGSGVELLPPAVFYPLGPVLSEHWWSRSSADLASVLSRETVAVHWYASVASRKLAGRVDAAYVRANRDRQLFSRLASRFADQV
jgi:Glycosyltransferase sugar-binding region containing DXD motif